MTNLSDNTKANASAIHPEHIAAISAAIYLYNLHDEESGQITIKNIDRRYSPWNSKVFGLNSLQK